MARTSMHRMAQQGHRRKRRNVARFLRRPWVEQRLFLLTLSMLLSTTLGVRVLGFKRWYALLARYPARAGWKVAGKEEPGTAYHLSRLVYLANRHARLQHTCLAQSLTLWWLLRCHGLQGDLRIGVRLNERQLEAHAWIEVEGCPLENGRQVWESFAAFDQAVAPNVSHRVK
ncbi:MAG: lasso peptide biosynthesis B2 protein [Caldilineaceae bacterium]|nr:lasso peptide biosynthesis B2 protein [Caldilineaceae bacterium]